MYRLTVDGDETYMIVTRNVFSHRLSVYKKYDLKVGGIQNAKTKALCIFLRGPRCVDLTFLEIHFGFVDQ